MRKVLLLTSVIMLLAVASFGQTPPPHSATLSWTNSTSACVVNTNVHRATTSGGEIPVGGTGSNFAVVPVAGGAHTFIDNTVLAGQTYFYTVSAWGSTCGGNLHESLMSNEIKAVIPADPCVLPSTVVNGVCTAPPNAPTGLTGTVQ